MSKRQEYQGDLSRRIGEVARILLTCGKGHMPISYLNAYLAIASRLDQIEVGYDHWDRPYAYIAWGFFDDDIVEGLVEGRALPMESSEWNGGLNLCFFDFCAPLGSARVFCSQLKRSRFQDYDQAYALEWQEGKYNVRRLTRRRSYVAATGTLQGIDRDVGNVWTVNAPYQ